MPLINRELEILRKHAEVKIASSLDEDHLIREAADADVLMVVYCKITKKLIDSARRLKGIVRYGIGLDNIDVAAATNKGIAIANIPDYSIEAVADHAFAFILCLNRKLLLADKLMRTGEYQKTWRSPPHELLGIDLKGKTLGIIGLGRIGRSLAAKAQGFRMNVVAYDPFIKEEMLSGLDVKLVDLKDLLSVSDFISIHAPLLPATFHLIGHEEFRLMKKTAYLVNVARGPVVDENALIKALKEGRIAGAGLDVYETEPPQIQNPLFELKNVILTPHIAWYTSEALHTLEMSAVDEAIRILKGQPPKNLVNKEVLSHNEEK